MKKRITHLREASWIREVQIRCSIGNAFKHFKGLEKLEEIGHNVRATAYATEAMCAVKQCFTFYLQKETKATKKWLRQVPPFATHWLQPWMYSCRHWVLHIISTCSKRDDKYVDSTAKLAYVLTDFIWSTAWSTKQPQYWVLVMSNKVICCQICVHYWMVYT